jgi:hypothetical protein
MGTKVQRKKGGARKIGRDVDKCKLYKAYGTRDKNKARKARKESTKAAKFARKVARRAE